MAAALGLGGEDVDEGGLELGVVVVEQVAAGQGDLQVGARLPGQAEVEFQVAIDPRGGERVDVAEDAVQAQVGVVAVEGGQVHEEMRRWPQAVTQLEGMHAFGF